jgi:uncharacterized protein YnzC (UPF0291/DUF896 family)
MAPMKNDSKVELVKRDDHYGLYDGSGQKIAATLDGCKYKLSTENCDEIFGVIDVEKLAIHQFRKSKYEIKLREEAFIDGFNKAMEINKDKLFTATNLRVGMINLLYLEKEKDELSDVFKERQFKFVDEYIQSLQQPTEIEVEIVTHVDLAATPVDSRHPDAYLGTDTGIPFLDENGCLILKKK